MAVAASYSDGARSGEVDVAYGRLTKEWRGKVIRLESNKRSGYSDFILVGNGGTFFAEVKGITHDGIAIPITAPQCEFLDDVGTHLGKARLLVLCGGEWWVGEPPFQVHFHLNMRHVHDMAPRRLLDVNDL